MIFIIKFWSLLHVYVLIKFQIVLLSTESHLTLTSIPTPAIIILHCMHNNATATAVPPSRNLNYRRTPSTCIYVCARATDVVTLESMIHMPIIAHTLKRVLIHMCTYRLKLFISFRLSTRLSLLLHNRSNSSFFNSIIQMVILRLIEIVKFDEIIYKWHFYKLSSFDLIYFRALYRDFLPFPALLFSLQIFQSRFQDIIVYED